MDFSGKVSFRMDIGNWPLTVLLPWRVVRLVPFFDRENWLFYNFKTFTSHFFIRLISISTLPPILPPLLLWDSLGIASGALTLRRLWASSNCLTFSSICPWNKIVPSWKNCGCTADVKWYVKLTRHRMMKFWLLHSTTGMPKIRIS